MSFINNVISLVPFARGRDFISHMINSRQFTFILAIITFAILLWYKVIMCAKAKEPLKVFLLLNSLMGSDIKIISPRYMKTGGKMTPLANFGMRITRKFVNIIVSKTILMREIPKLRHFTYFGLLILHFIAFYLYYRAIELDSKALKIAMKASTSIVEQQ